MEREESPVTELVRAARDGHRDAWDQLVDRYTPLVVSVVRGYRLQGSDTDDVVQTIWLRLVEHLGDIREPQALPGWIVTTARNECLRTLRLGQRTQPFDPLATTRASELAESRLDGRPTETDRVDDDVARAARHEALLQAFAALSDQHRELLLLLMTDPPPSYAEISRRLGIPVGSIGPTRQRALQRIRDHAAVRAWLAASLTDEARDPRPPSARGTRRGPATG